MDHELETAAADSAGGFFRFGRKAAHAAPVGTPCANCGQALRGPWCHACGQLGEDFHRSTRHLMSEAFESLFHFDGRFWRTLPDLILRPGGLTRDYLEGHRVPQIPPLRLFLVVLLVVFLAGSLTSGAPRHALPSVKLQSGEASGSAEPAQVAGDDVKVGQAIDKADVNLPGLGQPGLNTWLKARVTAAMRNPERFFAAMEQWGERFAFLLLPMSTLLLSLVFVFQRRFYVFDHAIFSLHSLSAIGLLLTVILLLDPLTHEAAGWLILLAPAHLFAHMRGVYRTSILGTLIRMAMVFIGSTVGFLVLILGLISVGLNAMGGG